MEINRFGIESYLRRYKHFKPVFNDQTALKIKTSATVYFKELKPFHTRKPIYKVNI